MILDEKVMKSHDFFEFLADIISVAIHHIKNKNFLTKER